MAVERAQASLIIGTLCWSFGVGAMHLAQQSTPCMGKAFFHETLMPVEQGH